MISNGYVSFADMLDSNFDPDSPEAVRKQLSLLSKQQAELARKQLSTLSCEADPYLACLGEELLDPRAELSLLSIEPGAGLRVLSGIPRAELSLLSIEPGAGLRVLSGIPARLLTELSKQAARRAGSKGGLARSAKQTPKQRKRLAMLGVEARRKKKE